MSHKSCVDRGMVQNSFSLLQPCDINRFQGAEFVCCPNGQLLLVVVAGSCWWLLLVVVASGCWWWLLVVAGGYWWLLVVVGGCWWLLVVFGGDGFFKHFMGIH